jgi:hypothetical protein
MSERRPKGRKKAPATSEKADAGQMEVAVERFKAVAIEGRTTVKPET